MNLSNLHPSPGSHQRSKRVGRGPGSHIGKTSGRGQKGQGARKSPNVRAAFEGGQNPLQRRSPKRGFNSPCRVDYQLVDVKDLERFDGAVSPVELADAGLVKKAGALVKILGKGPLGKALSVKANAFSAGAKSAIEAAKGTAETI